MMALEPAWLVRLIAVPGRAPASEPESAPESEPKAPRVQVLAPALVRPAAALAQEPEARRVPAHPELVRVQALLRERRPAATLASRALTQTALGVGLA